MSFIGGIIMSKSSSNEILKKPFYKKGIFWLGILAGGLLVYGGLQVAKDTKTDSKIVNLDKNINSGPTIENLESDPDSESIKYEDDKIRIVIENVDSIDEKGGYTVKITYDITNKTNRAVTLESFDKLHACINNKYKDKIVGSYDRSKATKIPPQATLDDVVQTFYVEKDTDRIEFYFGNGKKSFSVDPETEEVI
jgi:hypothetical protein